MLRVNFLSLAACVLFLSLAGLSGGRGEGGERVETGVTRHPGVGIVLQPYTARRGDDELSIAPDLLYGKVVQALGEMGVDVAGKQSIQLTPDEARQYGVWHRVALANAHLGRAVASLIKEGHFVLGLLGNCNSSWGMLAGLQSSGATQKPLRVGLIWMDAHGDFNTPETTLSGWLGGMPVSVAAGRSLLRLRLKAGLDPAIPTRHIIMMGLRDVDPLEQVLIDESHITTVSTKEMLSQSRYMQQAVDQLSRRVDVIYLHIDLDILDATEIPGSFFEVPGGPTAAQLAEPIRFLMGNPKVKALGVASFPTVDRGREKSIESTLTLIRGALRGLTGRVPRVGSRIGIADKATVTALCIPVVLQNPNRPGLSMLGTLVHPARNSCIEHCRQACMVPCFA